MSKDIFGCQDQKQGKMATGLQGRETWEAANHPAVPSIVPPQANVSSLQCQQG